MTTIINVDRRSVVPLLVFGLALFPVASLAGCANSGSKRKTSASELEAQADEIPWGSFSQELLAQSREGEKPLLLLVRADWCPACRLFEAQTLSDPDVIATVAGRFQPVIADVTTSTFDDMSLLRPRLPAIVIYGNGGQIDRETMGYSTVDSFLNFLTSDPNPNTNQQR